VQHRPSYWCPGGPASQLVLVSPLISILQSVQEQQSIHRASTELAVCLQYCQQWRRNAMADPNSAVTPLLLNPSPRCYRYVSFHPRGITAMFDPITAVNPRIPRYSRNPHYRAALYPVYAAKVKLRDCSSTCYAT